jgi:hypothetical protein
LGAFVSISIDDIIKFINSSDDNTNQILKNAIDNKRYNELKKTVFPYLDSFLSSTEAGEENEKRIVNEIFTNLRRITNSSHDCKSLVSLKKGEIKSIRMMKKHKNDKSLSYESRAISILDNKSGFLTKTKKYGGSISNTTFQQVKPAEFDFMLGLLVYKDGIDFFLLKSNLISKKVKIREQNYLFSVYNDGNNLYYFDRLTKTIKYLFTKVDIEVELNK